MRCVNLDNNPPGLWQDEASTGLDAWLIWHTGRDRTGALLPLISRSFGDYPLALYRYLTAPVVGLGGLTVANERAIAALFGTLLVAIAGAITWLKTDGLRAVCVIVAGALCPTWIHFSRYGSEAILLPATLALGWLAIDWGVQAPRRRWALWAGALSLGLSAYTYHAVKLILPLWMAGFLIYQWPNIKALWQQRARVHIIGPGLLFSLIVLPSARLALTPNGQARGKTVLAWYHHEGIELARSISNNYLSYFDPGMLFIRGGPAVAQSIPGLGMWNAIELPLMIVALATIFRAANHRRFYGFVLFWFLLGPLPGGVTYETHNMGRAIAWLPAPQLLSGTGLAITMQWAWHRTMSPANSSQGWSARATGASVLTLVPVGWLLTTYAVFQLTLVWYPTITERDWQFGVTRAIKCAKSYQTDQKFIISPAFPMAVLFSQFHLADRLLGEKNPSKVWDLGERQTVGPKELYAVPAHRPQPKLGRRICTVVQKSTGQAVAFVYKANK